MDLQLKEKTALILGGSKGLGRGVADALAAEGVAVALVARGQEALDRAVSEITSRGGKAVGFAADLANWPSVEDAANAARKQLGAIDILLNNSGGPPPSGVAGVSAKVWEEQFHAMVLPFFRLTDLLLGDMRARKWGRILNVASISVVEPLAAIGVSNTLRSAIVGWAKTLATETARDGITVNTLLPGVIATEETLAEESFEAGLLEYPHYTRPQLWRGRAVPEILLSGNHAKIKAWRRAEAEAATRTRRPDLWERYRSRPAARTTTH